MATKVIRLKDSVLNELDKLKEGNFSSYSDVIFNLITSHHNREVIDNRKVTVDFSNLEPTIRKIIRGELNKVLNPASKGVIDLAATTGGFNKYEGDPIVEKTIYKLTRTPKNEMDAAIELLKAELEDDKMVNYILDKVKKNKIKYAEEKNKNENSI
jgi:predicted CopG family antitoxin